MTDHQLADGIARGTGATDPNAWLTFMLSRMNVEPMFGSDDGLEMYLGTNDLTPGNSN